MFERVLGIVLDDQRIELCQINRGLQSFEITHSVSQTLPSDITGDRVKVIGDLIRNTCTRHHIQPDVIYSAISCGAAMFRHIYLPFSDMNKVGRVYPFEIEQTLPCSLDEVLMDFQIMSTDRESGTDILVAVLPKKTLEEHLGILKIAGMEPRITTLEPMGLLFLHQAFLQNKETLVECIVNLGPKKVTLVTVHQGKIVFTRQLDWNESDSGLSHLCDQIGLTLTSFMTESDAPIERIVLTGDYAHMENLDMLLFEKLGIQTESLNSYKQLPLKPTGNVLGGSPFLPAPLGLCLGKRFRKGTIWNFRQGTYAFQKKYTIPRQKAFILASCIIILLILAGMDLMTRSRFYKNRLMLIENEAQRILSQTLPNTKWSPETLSRLKKDIEEQSLVYEQYKGFFTQETNAIDLVRELSIRVPKEYDVFIQEILFQQGKVRIKGRVETFEMLDKVKTGLSRSKIFQKIKIEEANIKGKGNQVNFNMLLDIAQD